MLSDFFRYSLNNIGKRRLRSWLTMLGIFIGIASVVALIGLGQGLEQAILGEFTQLGSDKITIIASGGFGPPGSSSIAELTLSDYGVVKKVKGFDVVTKRILKTGTMEFDDVTKYPFIVSLPEPDEERKLVLEVLDMVAEDGRILRSSDNGKVMITHDMAHDADYKRPIEAGNQITVNGKKFEVVGIIKKSGVAGQSNYVLMNEGELRNLLNLDDFVSVIVGRVQNMDDTEAIQADIIKKLRKHRGVEEGDEDFDVQTPQQIIESFGTVFTMVQLVVVGIAAISLIVGAIGIMNTMYTAVLERRKEIGIMKAVGARNTDILMIFMMESGFLGLVGGLVGILFGVGFAKTAEFGAKVAMGSTLIQAHFDPLILLGIITFSFGIGLASGFLPAKQASALQPVKALRS